MQLRHYFVFPALIAATLAIPGLASCAKATPVGKTVAVSILPQAFFVERIAGGRFTPVVLVGEGASPHSYEPTPQQMAALSTAEAWFTINVDFEKGLKPKVSRLYPSLKLVDTTVGMQYRTLEAHHDEGEAEGHTDESGPDQHVWLGLSQAKVMAAHIRDTLAALDPEGKSVYEANCAALVAEADSLWQGLTLELSPVKGQTAFVFHPAFGYFLDDFGIKQEAVETGGKEPTQKTLTAMIDEAKADGARVIFVQAQFPVSAAESVATAIGGSVVNIDPLARNWLDNIRKMGDALKQGIQR